MKLVYFLPIPIVMVALIAFLAPKNPNVPELGVTTKSKIVSLVETTQSEKYQFMKGTVDGVKYQVDEYVSPKGSGYQVYLTYPNGSREGWGKGREAKTYFFPAPVLTPSSTL